MEVAETFLKALPDEEDDERAADDDINRPSSPTPKKPAVASIFAPRTASGNSISGSSNSVGGGASAGSAAAIAAPGKKQVGPKRFAPIALITEMRASELRDVLREMLIEFLELCRQLVLKTRTVLNVPRNAPAIVPRAVGEERTAEEVRRREVVWGGGVGREEGGGGGGGVLVVMHGRSEVGAEHVGFSPTTQTFLGAGGRGGVMLVFAMVVVLLFVQVVSFGSGVGGRIALTTGTSDGLFFCTADAGSASLSASSAA